MRPGKATMKAKASARRGVDVEDDDVSLGKKSAQEEKKQKKINPKIADSSHHKHPPYFEMIKDALLSLNVNETKGSSADAIAKFIEEKYNSSSNNNNNNNLPSNFRKLLIAKLKNCVIKDKLQKIEDSSYSLLSKIEREGIDGIGGLKTYIRSESSEDPDFMNTEDPPVGFCMPRKCKIRNMKQLENIIEKEQDLEKKMKWQERIPKAKKGVEAWEKYSRQLIESQGFDFDEYPRDVPTFPWMKVECLVGPLKGFETDEDLNIVCHRALDDFNTLNKTCFEFVKVVKANYSLPGATALYYATFQATLPCSHPPQYAYTFQARGVWEIDDGYSTDFCRLKKDASGNVVVSKIDDEGTKPAGSVAGAGVGLGVGVDVQAQGDNGQPSDESH